MARHKQAAPCKPERQTLRDLSFDAQKISDFQKSERNILIVSTGSMIVPCRIEPSMDAAQSYLEQVDFEYNQKKAISVYATSVIYAEMAKLMPQDNPRVAEFQSAMRDMIQRSAVFVPQPFRDDIPRKIKQGFELTSS